MSVLVPPSSRSGRTVLITRPEPGAAETARRVAALGWDALVAPMLRIEPRPGRLPGAAAVQAVLVTSASALPALPAEYHARPLLAVGDATAARARAAGFADVESAGRDAEALAALVARRCDAAGGTLLLASGQGQGMALAAGLRAAGFRVRRHAVYAALPARTLPAEARAALDGGTVAAALVFSAETARAFIRALRRDTADRAVADVVAVAIAPPTAAALAALPWAAIRVATAPTQEAMLEALGAAGQT